MRPIIGVFEGGGVRGIALAGAAAATMDAGYHFERAVGTSAGALVGALVAAGYGPRELRDVVCSIDWPGLLDPAPASRIPVLGRHLSVFFGQGVYRGEALERTWRELLARKQVSSFADLPQPLRVVVTDLSHTKGIVFPDHLAESGWSSDEFTVARAVRMSSAVPFLYRPVRFVDRRTGEVSLMSDGAMAANFPITVVDRSTPYPAVGYRFRPLTDHPHADIRGPLSFARAVIRSGIGAREGLPGLQPAVAELIEIPADRDGLDFDLDRRGARRMFDVAYEAAALHLGARPLAPA